MEITDTKGKVIFFTGATSGFGIVAACELASSGAAIIATCRSRQKGEELQSYYKNNYSSGQGSIELVTCDLTSFASIKKACSEFLQKYPKLDMIVNNAGVLHTAFLETEDNIEATWQVNLLSPTLIVQLLIEALKKGNDPKIIFTASGLHQGNIDFEDLEFRNRKFSSMKVYRQSKLGIILIARLLAKKLKSDNIAVYSQHPGFVNTDLGRTSFLFKMAFRLFGKSAEVGAQTLIHVATTPNKDLVNGEFYAKKKVKQITAESNDLVVAQKLLNSTNEYLKNHRMKNSIA